MGDNYQSFRLILWASNIPTYKLAKFLVSVLKFLISNEFTANHFYFAEVIIGQKPDFFVSSSLFPNIPLEDTRENFANELFKEIETMEGLSGGSGAFVSFHQRYAFYF